MMSGGDGISVLQIRAHGCSYRIGERPHDIMARSRAWMLWLPWTAMAAISMLQFGYGVAVVAVQRPHHSPAAGAFWVLALWVVFQAAATAATPTLRRRLGVGPSTAMSIGAVLSAIGPLTLSCTSNLGLAVLGYSVLCGTGAGIVYATCLSTVAHWYPEQRGAKVSLVSGAFGCGAVPFVVLFAFGLHPDNLGPVFTTVGLCVLVVVTMCGVFFRDPPLDWWPAEVDPRLWGVDKRMNRSLLGNAPAIRQYWPSEAARTSAFFLVYLIVMVASAAALLTIVYVPSIAIVHGLPLVVGAAAVAVLALVNGGGRIIASRFSDRYGRRQTLSLALGIEGAALLGLAFSASAGSTVGFVAFAALGGLAGGAFYSLFINLVADYFGERSAVGNFGLVYSAKIFGGLIGVGLPALLIPTGRLGAAFVAIGLLCLCAAAIAPRRLQRPGYPVCRLPN
ncbi:OFA family MFS transporter [Mycobacterium montefiorense]|uniref:OFA family MFS transporter n=2 Tax=Mycobacterium montefiorense TaxID=154654 RepID=UPI0021F3A40A|nr:OFA family MFS transporter [Mycobacterium montefiorense]